MAEDTGPIDSYEVTAEVAPDLSPDERGELTRFMRMVGHAVGDLRWVPDPRWRFLVSRYGGDLGVAVLDTRGRSQGTYRRRSDGTWRNEENEFEGRPGPDVPVGSIVHFESPGGTLGGTVLRSEGPDPIVGLADGSERRVARRDVLWTEPPAEG